jgi:hypothetical protein
LYTPAETMLGILSPISDYLNTVKDVLEFSPYPIYLSDPSDYVNILTAVNVNGHSELTTVSASSVSATGPATFGLLQTASMACTMLVATGPISSDSLSSESLVGQSGLAAADVTLGHAVLTTCSVASAYLGSGSSLACSGMSGPQLNTRLSIADKTTTEAIGATRARVTSLAMGRLDGDTLYASNQTTTETLDTGQIRASSASLTDVHTVDAAVTSIVAETAQTANAFTGHFNDVSADAFQAYSVSVDDLSAQETRVDALSATGLAFTGYRAAWQTLYVDGAYTQSGELVCTDINVQGGLESARLDVDGNAISVVGCQGLGNLNVSKEMSSESVQGTTGYCQNVEGGTYTGDTIQVWGDANITGSVFGDYMYIFDVDSDELNMNNVSIKNANSTVTFSNDVYCSTGTFHGPVTVDNLFSLTNERIYLNKPIVATRHSIHATLIEHEALYIAWMVELDTYLALQGGIPVLPVTPFFTPTFLSFFKTD